MRAYLAYIAINLKLTWRDRMVLFFNYLFPLVFFFTFAHVSRAEQGGAINWVFSSVLVIGVLGNGLFGGGIRAVVEREANILRRFKVAPITPAPILISSIVVGLVNFLPAALLLFAISHFRYGMPLPQRWLSALLLIIIGTIAFRTMGQIIASVANSMAESQIIIQSLYLPMLFLSGGTFPLSMLPNWVQIATQFIPATYLFSGMQNILVRNESLAENWQAVGALLLTTCLCLFISMKLFRWEKEEKLKPNAKLWVVGALAPFFLIGMWQAYSKDNLAKSRALDRDLRRSRTLLIKDARVFTGDGRTLESGSILIRNGRIAKIYTEKPPDARELSAEPIEASGKTVLPGLIDSHVILKPADSGITRTLAAYLFSGVTGVVSAPSAAVKTGDHLGAEIFTAIIAAPADKAALHEAIESPGRVIVGGNLKERIPDELFARMAQKGIAYIPLLLPMNIDSAWLDDTLVQQIGPADLLVSIRENLRERVRPATAIEVAYDNLRRAHAAGVTLLAASGAGSSLVPHGAGIHRELQLWVKAGIRPQDALEAATINPARILALADQRGAIREGVEATLLIVNGNPLAAIETTEAISSVIFKGERVDRTELFKQEK